MIVTLAALWLTVFGIWPAANPGHSLGDDPLVAVNFILHTLGVLTLIEQWRIDLFALTAVVMVLAPWALLIWWLA